MALSLVGAAVPAGGILERLDTTLLAVALQERAWFGPTMLLLLGLLGLLGWGVVHRTREVNRINAALRLEIGQREQTEGALQRVRGELERRVEDRTAELSLANQSLGQEIMERRRAEAELRDRAKVSAFAAEVGCRVTEEFALRQMLQRCAEALVRVLGVDLARIWLYRSAGPTLELEASAGLSLSDEVTMARLSLGGFQPGEVGCGRAPHLTNELVESLHPGEAAWAREHGLCAFAGHPLTVGPELVGVVAAYARAPMAPLILEALEAVASTLAMAIQRKQAEAALRESQARLALIFNNTSELISLVQVEPDDEFRLVAVNRAYVTFGCECGYEVQEGQVVGRAFGGVLRDVFHFDPAAVGAALARLRAVLRGGQPAHSEVTHATPQGTRFLDQVEIPVLTDGDRRGYLLRVARDVTARKEAETSQRRLEEQLRQAQKMEAMGTLAGGIAHDFNNILGAIVAYAELARMDTAGNAAAHESLAQIVRASERARELVLRILDFSRRGTRERKPVGLAPVLAEGLKLLRSTLPATIEMVTDIDVAAPPALADGNQIHQVLVNLCTNAAHALRGRPGRMEVRFERVAVDAAWAQAQPDLKPGQYVRLTVADTGHGMAPEVAKRIFDPFFTTKAPGEGTGLGLSVALGIVKEHQGAITVESQLGAGSRFEVYLPACADVLVREALPSSPDPPARATLGQGERILFVDDEPSLGEVARRILERQGFRVTTSGDPAEALALVRSEPDAYDLLFADLTMPGMTGIDLALQVFQLRPDLPILIASGFGGTWTPEAVKRLGIRDLVQKPLSPQTLGRMIHDALHRDRLA